ncbi:MAG: Holliday junction resolvase RuvX [Gammaproteobacteria bacterium]|nr:Holliday junction resolvase RuvX [Gammaproteobacteria bacterium]
MPDRLNTKVILGFDFGMKNIGVAVGQGLTKTATPLPPLKAQDGAPRWQEIQTLIDQWQPQLLLVGLPLHMDGAEQDVTRAARRFGNRLNGRFHLPVEWVDERLSSYEAEALISDLKNQGHSDKLSIDSVSAQLIVEQWFQQTNSQ